MFEKVLVANRGEIAVRAFRAATELGAKTVAVFPYEDRTSEHRLKADESYQIGEHGHPVRAYLDHESIVRVAQECGADAIYPGYGFLSENPRLAEACAAAGITFIGPPAEVLHLTGNKAKAIAAARAAGLPTLRSAEASDRPRRPRGGGRRTSASRSSSRPSPAAAAGGCAGSRPVAGLRDAARGRPARGRVRLRRPDALPRAGRRQPAAHRGPDPRGPPRRGHPPLRAGLLAPAASPEGHRDRPGPRPRPRPARAHLRRRRRVRRVDRLRQRRHGRVPRRRGRVLRLHRDEPPDPGRAHGHRGGHRRRPRRLADADRLRRDPRRPRARPRPASAPGVSPSSAGSRPRTPPTASAPTPGHHRLPQRRWQRHPARRRHGLRRRPGQPALRLDARQDDRPGTDLRHRAVAPGPAGPRGVPDPRGLDEHPLPRGRPRRPGLPGRPRDDVVHRRATRAAQRADVRRPRHQAADLPRRRHRQPAQRSRPAPTSSRA